MVFEFRNATEEVASRPTVDWWHDGGPLLNGYSAPWHRVANAFGGPTPAQQPTWGQLKATYRK
jgi:hypothetical protein